MNRKTAFSFTASPVSAEACQAIANIYLASAQRLAELNLDTIREVAEESVAASKSHHGKGGDSGFGFPQPTVLQPMVDKSMDYVHRAFAILVETQQEATKTLMSQFSGEGANYKLPTDWNAPLEMFNKGVKQFSTLATQGASATNEVARKASESLSRAIKAA